MARYDRIARIDPPDRDGAFSGWLALRDLDGRERETDLGRRARLRYLVLRPVHRLLRNGADADHADSIHQQLDGVRDELNALPAQDPERKRLDGYLTEIDGRSPGDMARASVDIGRAAEAGGSLFAAEEFFRTGLELARSHGDGREAAGALRHLGRVHAAREEWDTARTCLQEAAVLAANNGSLMEWARSMEGLAALQVREGDPEAAMSTLSNIEHRADRAGRTDVGALAAAGRCSMHLAQGDPAVSVEHGWAALEDLGSDDEARSQVLLDMGGAFRQLGLYQPATACYRTVARQALWPERRVAAELELAVVAAEAGDASTFAQRRDGLLTDLRGTDRPLQAAIWLGLGRGALLIGQAEMAQSCLESAIRIAEDIGDREVLGRAEALLSTVGTRREPGRSHGEPPPAVLDIAGRLLALIDGAPAPA